MTRTPLPRAFVIVCYGAVTFAALAAFRRFRDQSASVLVQWVTFYLLTVAYPMIWRMQHVRLLKKLGLAESRELLAYTWAPVVVGGTAFLVALNLLLHARG